jgi:hypothetical protein
MIARRALVVLALATACCAGDSSRPPTKSQVISSSGAIDPAAWDALCKQQGLPAGCDLCDALGWYRDGVCDAFCPAPHPACAAPQDGRVASPESGAESPDGTLVPPAARIVDSSGDIWTLTADGRIARDGVLEQYTEKVILLVYRSHVVWQETSKTSDDGHNLWWYWSGGEWLGPVGDPRP